MYTLDAQFFLSLTDFLTSHFSFGDNILLSSCFCSLSITSSCILSLTQMQAAFACYRMIHSGSCAVWHSTIVPSSNVQIASQTLSFICAVIVTKRDDNFSLNMLTSIYQCRWQCWRDWKHRETVHRLRATFLFRWYSNNRLSDALFVPFNLQCFGK